MKTTNTTTVLKQVHTKLLKDSVTTPRNTKSQRFIHIQRYSTMLRSLKNSWKIISVLSLVPLTTFFVKPDVALAGDFSDTCSYLRGEEIDGRYYLLADCKPKDPNRPPQHSRLAISDYIANYDGNLSWAAPLGKFHETCKEIVVEEEGGFDGSLSAQCKKKNGRRSLTSINLDERISNQDGVLTYDE